jgi:hypothetical protein
MVADQPSMIGWMAPGVVKNPILNDGPGVPKPPLPPKQKVLVFGM